MQINSMMNQLIQTALFEMGMLQNEQVQVDYHPSLKKWSETGEESALTEAYNSGMRFRMDVECDAFTYRVSVYELSWEDDLVLIVQDLTQKLVSVWSLYETEE